MKHKNSNDQILHRKLIIAFNFQEINYYLSSKKLYRDIQLIKLIFNI